MEILGGSPACGSGFRGKHPEPFAGFQLGLLGAIRAFRVQGLGSLGFAVQGYRRFWS